MIRNMSIVIESIINMYVGQYFEIYGKDIIDPFFYGQIRIKSIKRSPRAL